MSTQSDAVELASCPFCGGNAALSWDDVSKLSFVECIECGTESGHAELYDNAKAIAAWNRRSPDLVPALTQSVEMARDAKRYRWLRSKGGWKHVDPPGTPNGISVYWSYCSDHDDGNDAAVDAAIDRALAEEKQRG